jgi:hypothetical protein
MAKYIESYNVPLIKYKNKYTNDPLVTKKENTLMKDDPIIVNNESILKHEDEVIVEKHADGSECRKCTNCACANNKLAKAGIEALEKDKLEE